MTLPSDGELRLRYLDWCSAKVAERFQRLSEDEVWERAQRPPPASPPSPTHPGYLDLVRRLSIQLADELGLPPFRVWREAYRLHPDSFEREMIGFGADRALEEPPR